MRSRAWFQRIDRAVAADDEQAVVERLEDVLVEHPQAVELRGLDVQLAIEARVLDRGGDLAGHRRHQPEVVAGQRLAVLAAAEAEHRDDAPFETHGTK